MHRMMIFIHEKFQVIRQHSLVKPYGILSTRQRRLQQCCGQEQNYVWVPIIPCLYPSDSQKHLIDGNLLVLVNKGQQIRAEKLAFFTMFKYITVCHSIYEIFLFIASARKKKEKKKISETMIVKKRDQYSRVYQRFFAGVRLRSLYQLYEHCMFDTPWDFFETSSEISVFGYGHQSRTFWSSISKK